MLSFYGKDAAAAGMLKLLVVMPLLVHWNRTSFGEVLGHDLNITFRI